MPVENAVITLKSPIAWLLIWSSFVTAMFIAYGVITVSEFLHVQLPLTAEASPNAGPR